MKIALVDNMNNNFFALARYLRDFGVDVDLYVIPGASAHFNPQCDTFADTSAMSWIREFPSSYNPRTLLLPATARDWSVFKAYDLIVACGYSMGILRRAGYQPDVFIPYGGDLYQVPFASRWPSNRSPYRRVLTAGARLWVSYAQRAAIINTRVVVTNPLHRMHGDALERMGIGCLNMNVPIVYRESTAPGNTRWEDLDESDFVAFNHSRHLWRSNPDRLADFSVHGGSKRNDKIIRAFGEFLRTTSFRSATLVTFEYGPDVEASKDLIREIGIEDHVRWRPVTERRDILLGLSHAHVAFDQLRNGLSGIGGTGYEVMCSGVPLVTHTNGATTNPAHPFFGAPIIDVLEESEVLGVFRDIEAHPGKYQELGSAARAWFDEHMGTGLAHRYLDLFSVLAKDRTLTHDSPIVQRFCVHGARR
jgi:glycosyltransferase involved in cell wall biosynthesis